ncbi:MAG TPA: ABC transporter ATP-binding protein [Actinomycetota bacterium]|nr:ABC transporter ATP-binding protein [Actinomycetota bacterium]
MRLHPPRIGAGPAATRAPGGTAGPAIAIRDVTKTYADGRSATKALEGLTLDVAPGEFVCILGASGCGKSTLLNLIAGIYRTSAGTIDVAGRRIALMFQEPALFPWLTVQHNVEMGMRFRRSVTKERRREEARRLLRLMHLEEWASRRPHELSGGMRQRVALARALAQEAEILLMDEPFGSLDAITRDLLHEEIERIWLENRLTIVFVTHNVREAVRLGDRVVLLSSRPGRLATQFPVGLGRPRRLEDAALGGIAAEISARLHEEVRRHGR